MSPGAATLQSDRYRQPTFCHRSIVDREPVETARLLARLLRDAELRDGVRYVQLGAAMALPVEHDADGRCCARQDWFNTIFGLIADEARRRGAVFDAEQCRPIAAPTLDTIEATVEALARDIDDAHAAGIDLPFTGADLTTFYARLLRSQPRALVLNDVRRRWQDQGDRRVRELRFPHPRPGTPA